MPHNISESIMNVRRDESCFLVGSLCQEAHKAAS